MGDTMKQSNRNNVTSLLLISLILTSQISSAGELVYTPLNPAFGGNPFNASGLLSSAQSQNNYKEKRVDPENGSDLLDNFEESLNRQIFSRLSREIIAAAFGENDDAEFTEGTYHIGDYLIVIDPQDQDMISIVITDDLSGNTTTIQVPYYDTQVKE